MIARDAALEALRDLALPTLGAVGFALIALPFLYEWNSGYLEWVRSDSAQRRMKPADAANPIEAPAATEGA